VLIAEDITSRFLNVVSLFNSKETVALADQLLRVLKEFDPRSELNCNRAYIGLSKDGRSYNFVTFKPKKSLARDAYNQRFA